MKKIVYITILLAHLFLGVVWAQSFTVQNIKVEGLHYISEATVESYLPIKRGQIMQPAKSPEILRALYKTGFFDRITLAKSGNTLIIRVIERQTIGQLKIAGNSVIPTDKLTTVMKSLDVAEGRVYNPVIIDKIRQSLLNQYYQLGRYNARVDVNVTAMSRSRVSLKVNISEGAVARIRRITIIGNHAFTEKKLVKQLDITTSGLITFFTQTDRYSEGKLEENLEKLRGFYLDHGYLRVEIKSSQAEITPDRKYIYVTIVIKEGQPYQIKNLDVQGNLVFAKSEFLKRITVKPGETFSRQKIFDSEKAITDFLGDHGYIFATVSLRPNIYDAKHEVSVIFDINPGTRAYVRHVTFSDNNRTNDHVLRREIRQFESAPASRKELDESKHRLSLLPYIRDVEMSVKPVPDKNDQVDVNYKVTEHSSAEATFKIGYSQTYGVLLGAGFNQKNIFGSGNTLGVNLSHSRYEQFYGIDYTDPYYTADGISRSFTFSISQVDPAGIGNNINNIGYTTNQYSAGILYGIPIGQEEGVVNTVQAGLGYENTIIKLVNKNLSNQVADFVAQHGRHYHEADLKLGYFRDSRDRAIFPTRGGFQSIFANGYAPLSSSSLSFYQVNYEGKWYYPLTQQFIVLNRVGLGFGRGLHSSTDYPFYKYYLAGGIDTVRGYQGYSLGPRDSNGNALGGNMLVDASVGLIFPNYLSDNLRTSLYVDAGNVYSSYNNRAFGGKSTDAGPLRYSTGVQADWITPFGPISLSLAKTISAQPHDRREPFQFALSSNF